MLDEQKRKAARAEIAMLVSKAESIISEAEGIADKNNVTFDFDLAYGMGGTYIPKGSKDHYLDSYEAELNEDGSLVEGQWVSSSQSC